MQRLRERGVTILMVTHSSGSILDYANRCIVLDRGRVTHDTVNILEAVLAYEKGMLPGRSQRAQVMATSPSGHRYSVAELCARRDAGRHAEVEEQRFGTARAIIDELTVRRAGDAAGESRAMITAGEEVIFSFRLLAAEHLSDVVLGVSLSLAKGSDVWGDNNLHAGQPLDLEPGELCIEYRVRLPLSAGEYLIHAGLARLHGDQREELDQRRPIGRLRVWSPREQVGVVHAPVTVSFPGTGS